MVARSEEYFVPPFKGYCGATHRNPWSPTILYVVLDTVLRYCLAIVASTEEALGTWSADTEGFGKDVKRLAEYFYSDNRILGLTRVAHLQSSFDILTEILYHLVPYTNVFNTMSINC